MVKTDSIASNTLGTTMLIDFSYIEDVILPISRKIIEGNPKRLHPAGVLIPVAKGKKQVTAFPLAGGNPVIWRATIAQLANDINPEWYLVLFQGTPKPDPLLIVSYCDRDVMRTWTYQILDIERTVIFKPRPDITVSYPVVWVWGQRLRGVTPLVG